jgi:AhpD family alkylhydroperoxidase
MPNHHIFIEKEKALVAIGASVAAGCQPCTEHHIKVARAAGACERSVWLAVETALAVRESATRAMDRWAGQCQGDRPPLDAEFRAEKRRIAALASVAAAAAVNSVPDFQAQLEAACQSGATPDQIRAAFVISNVIKRTAEQKLAAAILEQSCAAELCCASAPEPAAGCGCR